MLLFLFLRSDFVVAAAVIDVLADVIAVVAVAVIVVILVVIYVFSIAASLPE